MGVGDGTFAAGWAANGEVEDDPGSRWVRPALSRRRRIMAVSERRSSVAAWRSRRSASYQREMKVCESLRESIGKIRMTHCRFRSGKQTCQTRHDGE